MGTECDRLFENALAYGASYDTAYVVGLETCDNAVSYMAYEGLMGVKNRAGVDIYILYALFGNGFHNHVENIVAVSQMVVEGDRHAVLKTAEVDDFFERRYNLIHLFLPP